ncbi:hypothetical protein [Sphingomonas sp. TDK1]|uniref:hypothetical protein n=1 Tax=Sphingomonas sp. TDK1 TaxID=453247 RepID=UPI0007DA1C95|nr:hypothetical protein [Sphingomonas sp. TDK1]OAN62279.1 hypothetical protein A7X12_22590 [Sphingomonas sp. TDK1]
MTEIDPDYLLRRLAQSRRAAERATESSARAAHLAMADHYAAVLRSHAIPVPRSVAAASER